MKTRFFCGLSVLVVAIAAASCAGQSNKPTSTPAQTSNSQPAAGCYFTDHVGWECPNTQASPNPTIPRGVLSKGTGNIPGAGNADGGGGGHAGAFTAGSYEALQQGSNSVVDLNVSKRGRMVSSALRNWQAPAEQQNAATTLAQNTSLADPFAANVTGPSPTPEDLFLSGLETIVDLGDKWEVTKGVKDITEPFSQLSDALTRAGAAGSGDTTICPIDSVNALYSYVSKQKDYLQQLSQNPDTYWLKASGVNAFNPSTIPPAQAYLDGWSDRLARVQRLIRALNPMVGASQNVLANPAVLGPLMYKGYMTDVVGCSDVLGQVNSGLSAASGAIDKLVSQLSDARSVVY